ncbi:MAG: hypothetical protein ACRDBG_16685 [Waterburya sp.]
MSDEIYYTVEYTNPDNNRPEQELFYSLSEAFECARKFFGKITEVHASVIQDYGEDYQKYLQLKSIFEPNLIPFPNLN